MISPSQPRPANDPNDALCAVINMPAELRGPPFAVAAGETLREIALSYNVDHSTIHRLSMARRGHHRTQRSNLNRVCLTKADVAEGLIPLTIMRSAKSWAKEASPVGDLTICSLT